MPTIQDVCRHLESIAPPSLQEGYDNAQLITGRPEWEVKGVMVCLDAIEPVIEEAIQHRCNLVVAHHPIVFKGLKSITGEHYVERVVIQAIRHNIAIYAIHTNLDNVRLQGVNTKIAERLGLEQTRTLSPKGGLEKLTFTLSAESGMDALKAIEALGIRPVVHPAGPHQQLIEAIVGPVEQPPLRKLIRDSGGEVWYSHQMSGKDSLSGSGMFGLLSEPMPETEFLAWVKERLKTRCIRHTRLLGNPVQRVALCGGAGSFLFPHALKAGADAFITADYKYHEFFEADGQILILDVGHFESEQFTIELLHHIISQKFSTFAVRQTEVVTNPVFYY